MEKTFICSICGMEHPVELRTYFNNTEFCVRCVETEFTHCSHCGQRIWRADNSGTRDTPLCDNCFTHRTASNQQFRFNLDYNMVIEALNPLGHNDRIIISPWGDVRLR